MDLGVGEEFAEFLQDVFSKLNRLGICHIEHVGRDTARHPKRMRTLRPTTELRVCCHSRNEVPRHVDFRDDFDVALLSVGHDILNFFLRIEVRTVLFVSPVVAMVNVYRPRVCACGTNGSEFGITLNFYAPTLVVGQVPVEAVHLIYRHDVEHALYFFHSKEVARHVEHEAAVTETGFVVNAYEGKGILCHRLVFYSRHDVGRKNFLHRLKGVVETRTCLRLYLHTVGIDNEFVTLRVEFGGRAYHLEERRGVIARHRSVERSGKVNGVDKLRCFGGQTVGKVGGVDHKICGERK